MSGPEQSDWIEWAGYPHSWPKDTAIVQAKMLDASGEPVVLEPCFARSLAWAWSGFPLVAKHGDIIAYRVVSK